MSTYHQLPLFEPERLTEYDCHKWTEKCPHIDYSWQQKDGVIIKDGKRIIQLCAKCKEEQS